MTRVEIMAAVAAEREVVLSNDHDLEVNVSWHDDGSIAWAAACYAAPGTVYEWRGRGPNVDPAFPWSDDPRPLNHGKDRVRDLIKAAALCIAEIERLQCLAQENGR